jgi:hypothetical protein
MPEKNKKMEEVGDLFVSESSVTVKLLPSKKQSSRTIRWFANGEVTNVKLAAKDIATLIGKLQGRGRVVKRLTVMTDRGTAHDLTKTGLHEAVERAGFDVIK